MESQLAVLADDASIRGHRTLAEKAFGTLHTAIITGRLRPGARLPIEELAELLEMSPMPIREALRRLDAAGLVDNIPHRGARVTELSITDLEEVYEARLALETLAIRRAAERFTAEDEALARERLEALHRMPDDNSGATSAAHEELHFALYGAARLGLAAAADPPRLGDQRALLPRGSPVPAARRAHRRARRDRRRMRGRRSRSRRPGPARPPREHRQQHRGRDGR